MAVFEQAYKPYEGPLTPEWSRFLIIPRYAYRQVFRSKLFTAFFAISFIWPLVCAILIYLHHNANALAAIKANVSQLLPIDATFFEAWLVAPQGITAFFIAMLVGPPQVSRDLTNNALPLYLCRPFTRTEYVAGKMSIVIILLSAMTWVPGLMLFLFQSYLEGWSWFSQNISIASAIFPRQSGLDSLAGVDVADNFGLGEVARGVERGVARGVLYSDRVCRGVQ